MGYECEGCLKVKGICTKICLFNIFRNNTCATNMTLEHNSFDPLSARPVCMVEARTTKLVPYNNVNRLSEGIKGLRGCCITFPHKSSLGVGS